MFINSGKLELSGLKLKLANVLNDFTKQFAASWLLFADALCRHSVQTLSASEEKLVS